MIVDTKTGEILPRRPPRQDRLKDDLLISLAVYSFAITVALALSL